VPARGRPPPRPGLPSSRRGRARPPGLIDPAAPRPAGRRVRLA
jgi:hypothetical protein